MRSIWMLQSIWIGLNSQFKTGMLNANFGSIWEFRGEALNLAAPGVVLLYVFDWNSAFKQPLDAQFLQSRSLTNS